MDSNANYVTPDVQYAILQKLAQNVTIHSFLLEHTAARQVVHNVLGISANHVIMATYLTIIIASHVQARADLVQLVSVMVHQLALMDVIYATLQQLAISVKTATTCQVVYA